MALIASAHSTDRFQLASLRGPPLRGSMLLGYGTPMNLQPLALAPPTRVCLSVRAHSAAGTSDGRLSCVSQTTRQSW